MIFYLIWCIVHNSFHQLLYSIHEVAPVVLTLSKPYGKISLRLSDKENLINRIRLTALIT